MTGKTSSKDETQKQHTTCGHMWTKLLLCSKDSQTFHQWSLWPVRLARRSHLGKQVSCTWLLRQASTDAKHRHSFPPWCRVLSPTQRSGALPLESICEVIRCVRQAWMTSHQAPNQFWGVLDPWRSTSSCTSPERTTKNNNNQLSKFRLFFSKSFIQFIQTHVVKKTNLKLMEVWVTPVLLTGIAGVMVHDHETHAALMPQTYSSPCCIFCFITA